MAKQSHFMVRVEQTASLISTAALLAVLGVTTAMAQPQPSPEELRRQQQQRQQQERTQQQQQQQQRQQQERTQQQQQQQQRQQQDRAQQQQQQQQRQQEQQQRQQEQRQQQERAQQQQQQQQQQGGQTGGQQGQGRSQPSFLPPGRQQQQQQGLQRPPGGDGSLPPGVTRQTGPQQGQQQQQAVPQRGQTPPLPGNLPGGRGQQQVTPQQQQTPPSGTQQGAPGGGQGGPPSTARPGVPFTPPAGTPGGFSDRRAPPVFGTPGGAPSGQGTASPGGSFVTRPGIANPSAVASPAVRPIAGPRAIEQVRQGRVESINRAGQRVIQEPGNRTIVRHDNRTIITRNEATLIRSFQPGARTTARPGGISETVFVRPGGARVFTETDGSGRLLRRYRRDPSGRDIVLVDNRRFYRNLAIGVGAGVVAGAVILALSRPAHAVPRHQYVVNYVDASDDDCYVALTAPPVVRLERTYSLDEIRFNEPLRAHVRRVDLDNITFETGSFEVSPEQYGKLDRIARAIGRAIEANPSEVFLIEGHTDAVGASEDNLSLSDRRAESVMRILSEHYNIPIENLVTQGYGEQYPKVETDSSERSNRRVSVRRITQLLNQEG